MTLSRSRQAAGTPVGGQFATEARTEPQVSLAAPTAAQGSAKERMSAGVARRMAELGPVLCGVSNTALVRGSRPIDADRIAGEVANEVLEGGWGEDPTPTRDQLASLIAEGICDYDMVELDPSDLPPADVLADLADGGTYGEIGEFAQWRWGKHPENPRNVQFGERVAEVLDVAPGTDPGEVRRWLKSLRSLARRGDNVLIPVARELSDATRRLGGDGDLPGLLERVRDVAAAHGMTLRPPTHSPAPMKEKTDD